MENSSGSPDISRRRMKVEWVVQLHRFDTLCEESWGPFSRQGMGYISASPCSLGCMLLCTAEHIHQYIIGLPSKNSCAWFWALHVGFFSFRVDKERWREWQWREEPLLDTCWAQVWWLAVVHIFHIHCLQYHFAVYIISHMFQLKKARLRESMICPKSSVNNEWNIMKPRLSILEFLSFLSSTLRCCFTLCISCKHISKCTHLLFTQKTIERIHFFQ